MILCISYTEIFLINSKIPVLYLFVDIVRAVSVDCFLSKMYLLLFQYFPIVYVDMKRNVRYHWEIKTKHSLNIDI